MIEVREAGLTGRYFPPTGKRSAVLVLGGSEGGLERATRLSRHVAAAGHGALALAYFGLEGLPPALELVPLETFHRAVAWLSRQPGIDAASVGVLGGSKGAEAALLVGATCPSVGAVVAFVPSHVAFQSITAPPRVTSSWTLSGVPVPFVPYRAPAASAPPGLLGAYVASIADREAVARAAIPVEHTRGAILLLSGAEDGLWPASEMAERVAERLRARAFAFPYAHVRYPQAGHSIVGPDPAPLTAEMPWGTFHFGGTEEGNASARADAWARALRFLDQHLGDRRAGGDRADG